METQNQIKRTLSQPDAIKHICRLLEDSVNITRTELANQLCNEFSFFDPRGRRQQTACLYALQALEKADHFILPPRRTGKKKVAAKPRRLTQPPPPPLGLPAEVDKVKHLRLVRVETDEHMRTWNEIMIQDHPRGAGPLVGRQIRYLVESEHGLLGGLGFSAAALHLHDRDKWIGWDRDTRLARLHYVVNMSRFLIRDGIACRNLASCVLGMSIRQLPLDFEERYGFRPLLLESFVDTNTHEGTCYRAANWLRVGRSKGRGRYDLLREHKETIKDIYVYPLAPNFRLQLGLDESDGFSTLEILSGLDGDSWADNEFGGAPVGDKRLSRRLVEVARDKGENPGRSYSGAADGEWSKVKGYYRLIDHPNESAVTMENILLPHRERTMRRMMDYPRVLCIQDGSDLDYNNLDRCEGLGTIGTNQTGAQSKGLHLHSTLVVTPEGLPLGVLRADCTAPEFRAKDDKPSAAAIPIEEKKTFSWIKGLRDCSAVKAQMPRTSLVAVMDREADFFELFDEQRTNCANVDLLVRAKHDRKITKEDKLFESVRLSPVQSRLVINVPRQSARSKKSKQKARPRREKRCATVSLRYRQVEIPPPQNCQSTEPTISLWVVHVSEENPPPDTKPLEWFLLTTLDITSVEDAINCVEWYIKRWRIEDWHRVLKSGCKVEDLAHKTADRLRRAIAINIVVAWRIMLMTLLGREAPELPPEILFSDLEIKVLKAYAKKKELQTPDCLGSMVKLVAKIGGYLGRSNDPPPGHQLIWQGYYQLQLMCEGFALWDG